jgi:two-component system, NtrC family, sensor kinase
MQRWRWGLQVKLLATVCGAALAAFAILAYVGTRYERAARVDLMIRGASQFSDTVKRSISHAMLANHWGDAFHIMEAIGAQEEVKRVRVFSKAGTILFSTDRSEVGRTVDTRAESCFACHAAGQPLTRLPMSDRARIFQDGDGGRLLGMITPLYNEPGCGGSCHVHPPDTRILGVLDITLSLAKVDEEMAAVTRRALLYAGGTILLLAFVVLGLVRRDVIRPLLELVDGTRRVAAGELAHRIPAIAQDEVGALARAFNQMTEALEETRRELETLVATLEQRVAERTRALEAAQARLIQTEKLASLGRLSASIAHEINNPLSGILTYAKLVSRRLRVGSPGPEELLTLLQQLALVERETQRCSAIVRNLLDFARQREPVVQSVALGDVLDEAVGLLAARLGAQGVTVERDEGATPPVRADFGQLRQAVVNILGNACEAMRAGGTVRIVVRERPQEAGVDRAVLLEVTDQGEGIPPEHLPRIFDPFFTTKEGGTGLGLSVVYGIVEQHGGTIHVDSRPGSGTTVSLLLPVGPLPSPPEPAEER